MATCGHCGTPVGLGGLFACRGCNQLFCVDHRLPERHDCTNPRVIRSAPKNRPRFGASRVRHKRRGGRNRTHTGRSTGRRRRNGVGIIIVAVVGIVAVGALLGLPYLDGIGVISMPDALVILDAVTDEAETVDADSEIKSDPHRAGGAVQDELGESADSGNTAGTEQPSQTAAAPDAAMVEPEQPIVIQVEPPEPASVQIQLPDIDIVETVTPLVSTSEEKALAESRILMLDLINEERIKRGLNPVSMGSNTAAQAHADSMLATCTSSHWGTDGLKPYMRYSQAGGYQHNAENVAGLNYCVGYGYISETPNKGVSEAMRGLMASPGHRDNILDPRHAFVNVGVANDGYNTMVAQHFEYDYVSFGSLPEIDGGIASFVVVMPLSSNFDDYYVTIYYDPPPHSLEPGQLSRTYCYNFGVPVVSIRPFLSGGWEYTDSSWISDMVECPDPYNMPTSLPAPSSPQEALSHHEEATRQEARAAHVVPWNTASNWKIDGDRFEMKADIMDTIEQHGPGVYTFHIGGFIGDEYVPLGTYSVFHGIPVSGGR